jgi:pimeloyl-ACP methyl ester carboxylesterase
METGSNEKLINYVVQGEGKPVLLIHGIAASLQDWQALMPALAETGFHTHAVDLLGHGDSHKPDHPQHYSYRVLYAALEDWIDSLGIDPPYTLVGHSLGGHLSLCYGLRNPNKMQSLVLINPLYSTKQLALLLRPLHRRPLPAIRLLQATPERLLERLIQLDVATLAEFSPQARKQIAIDLKRASPNVLNILRTIPDLTPDLERIQTSTLVIWGEKDLTLNPASFPRLVSSLPKASGQPIPNCGHQPHIVKPDLVNRLILDFLTHHDTSQRSH